MSVFNPQLITDPRLNPLASVNAPTLAPQEAPAPIAPPAPAPAPQPVPVFVPVPMQAPIVPVRKGLTVSPEVARKAQGIYPVEQQAKQQMIDNAKTPTPTGAWGSTK